MFCYNHKIDNFLLDVKQANKKPCRNYIRGCRNMLDISGKSACETCLVDERVKDKERRDKKRIQINENNKNNNILICEECNDEYATIQLEKFIDKNGKISYKCENCRQKLRVIERRRIKKNIKTNESIAREKMKDAKYEVKITINDVIEILQKSCFYCGDYNTDTNCYGVEYSLMSMDRINSNGCYTKDNIVTACCNCNYMKFVYSIDEFITHCNNIFLNFGSKNLWQDNEYVNRITISRHKQDCKRDNKKTELTKDDIYEITKYKCYYCNNTNYKNQIGIDRIDSVIGYTKNNKLVACCGICNNMKKDMILEDFYNHILKILLFNKKITQKQYDDNYKQIKKSKNQKKWIIEQLAKIHEYDGKDNKNRMNIHNFNKPSKYYINKIWKGFNIIFFEPELEFCESDEQINTWMFYRLTISSHFPSKCSNMDIKILIRDTFTKKYVAFTSLTCSRPNWSNATNIGKILRYSNVYNITTCVSIPPFSYNFNGGKLATMLMFSKEVYEYMLSKEIIIAGLMTYSLHGDSIQYSGIDDFKIVGYTKGEGKDNTRVPFKIYQQMIKIMKNENYPIETKEVNIKRFCAENGLIDATKHGVKRAIYFGTMGCNSMEYLRGNTEKFNPTKLKSIKKISEIWYINYVLPRINELIKRNNIMVEYDYDSYYIDDSGYNRHRKNKSLMKKRTFEDDNNKYNENKYLINFWFSKNDFANTEFNDKKIDKFNDEKIDKRKLNTLIFQNDYKYIDEATKNKLELHIKKRKKLVDESKNKITITKNIDKILEKEFNYFNNKKNFKKLNDLIFSVEFKKNKLYFVSQKFNKLTDFTRLFNVDNIKTGKWMILLSDDNDNTTLMKLWHVHCSNYENDYSFKSKIIKSENILFKIGIIQVNKELNIGYNDLNLMDTPFRKTGKNNLFLNIYRKCIVDNLELILGYEYDDYLKIEIITYIEIKPKILLHKGICTCCDCINFLIKKTQQYNEYEENYYNF